MLLLSRSTASTSWLSTAEKLGSPRAFCAGEYVVSPLSAKETNVSSRKRRFHNKKLKLERMNPVIDCESKSAVLASLGRTVADELERRSLRMMEQKRFVSANISLPPGSANNRR